MSEEKKPKHPKKGEPKKAQEKSQKKPVRSKKTKSLDPSIPLLELNNPSTWSPWYEAMSLWCQTTCETIPFLFADMEYPDFPVSSEDIFDRPEFQNMSAEARKIVLDRE